MIALVHLLIKFDEFSIKVCTCVEVIRLDHEKDVITNHHPPLALALGFFDGVHRGHQEVILTAKKEAENRGLKSAVMTFDPSPKEILGKAPEEVKYITLLDEKIEEIAKLGIDYLFIVSFTKEFADILPEAFVDQFIIPLNAKHVVAGFDFTYGKFGKGNMETLKIHAKGHFTVTTVEKLTINDEKISSTIIRSLIHNGKVDLVPTYLGRFYTTKGTVIHGEKRGRTIGFPTANIQISDRYVFPQNGVYIVRMKVREKWENGICNIGYKPTFHKEIHKQFVEVHLFDFDESIYGEKVIIEWQKRLRAEQKFSSVAELVAQIEKDKEQAIRYFQS